MDFRCIYLFVDMVQLHIIIIINIIISIWPARQKRN